MYDRQLWFESPVQAAGTRPLRQGLAGLGSVNQLAVDMPDQTVRLFYGITTDLGAALSGGGKPQRPYNMAQFNVVSPVWGLAPNGYYNVQTFMGGFLLDGCPLNVIFGQGWLPGQQAALQQAGIASTCPQVSPMTPTVPLTTANPLTTQPPSQTFVPYQTPTFVPTITAGGIIGGPSPAAPQTQVISSQAPALPTGLPDQVGIQAPALTYSNEIMIAVGVLAVIVLTRKKG